MTLRFYTVKAFKHTKKIDLQSKSSRITNQPLPAPHSFGFNLTEFFLRLSFFSYLFPSTGQRFRNNKKFILLIASALKYQPFVCSHRGTTLPKQRETVDHTPFHGARTLTHYPKSFQNASNP